MSKTRLWLTGATGFVGGHFIHWVLQNSDCEIVALVRRRSGADARTRLLESLDMVAASYRQPFDREAAASRLRVVHGDITLPGCGVDAAELPASEPSVGEHLWHIAASLNFEERHRDRIRLHNVDGTRNALGLADRIGAARYVQVSTAYTCGKFSGTVPEELHDLDRTFNNVYEQTKCEGEHEVAAWGERTGVSVAIVRPSIVVGPALTHDPGGSDSGLYGFAREIYRLRKMLCSAGQSLTMCGDADAPLNLIPVDEAVREMWRLANSDFAGGLVHHVTSDRHPTVRRVLEVVGEQCGIGPVRTVAQRGVAPSPVEETIDRRATFYSSYLRDEKSFSRRSGPKIEVSEEDLQHFVREFIKERRGENVDSIFRRDQLRSWDGQLLVSYSAGDPSKPCIVLSNAYGVPCDVWVPLVGMLAGDFHVITWKLRQGKCGAGPDVHASDMEALMNHHGVASAHVVGWCTGADVALRFAEMHPGRAYGVVTVSGALNGVGAAETAFQRNMRRMVDKAAGQRAHAELFYQILFGTQRTMLEKERVHQQNEDRSMLSSMLGALDPALLHLTSAPFRSATSLHHYARTMREHYDHAARVGLPMPDSDTLVIVATQDEVVHTAASRRAASSLPHARMVELEEADHFALYTDRRVGEMVREFVQRERVAAPALRASA